MLITVLINKSTTELDTFYELIQTMMREGDQVKGPSSFLYFQKKFTQSFLSQKHLWFKK